jgi:hypothetical protein
MPIAIAFMHVMLVTHFKWGILFTMVTLFTQVWPLGVNWGSLVL